MRGAVADHKLTGKTFGQLTVLEASGYGKNRNLIFTCGCTCGPDAVVQVRSDNLISGNTQSCGCFGKKQRAKGSARYAAKQAKAKKRKGLALHKGKSRRIKRGLGKRRGRSA